MLLWWILRVAVVDLGCCCGGSCVLLWWILRVGVVDLSVLLISLVY